MRKLILCTVLLFFVVIDISAQSRFSVTAHVGRNDIDFRILQPDFFSTMDFLPGLIADLGGNYYVVRNPSSSIYIGLGFRYTRMTFDGGQILNNNGIPTTTIRVNTYIATNSFRVGSKINIARKLQLGVVGTAMLISFYDNTVFHANDGIFQIDDIYTIGLSLDYDINSKFTIIGSFHRGTNNFFEFMPIFPDLRSAELKYKDVFMIGAEYKF